MSDILSQGEIDALLEALTSGEMNADELKKEEGDKKVKVYDFKRALRFSKDQIRTLTRIHENFARVLTTYFSAQLRTLVQISVVSVDQIPYDEFIKSIPTTTILNIFSAKPLEGRMVLEMNPNIAYAMLDRVLGGPGVSPSKISSLTEIETNIMTVMFAKALDSFKDAWKGIIDLSPKLDVLEINPQFMQIVSANETVIVISFSTKIGDTTGMMNLCLPHVVLESILQDLSEYTWTAQERKNSDEIDYSEMSGSIQLAKLPFIVELGESSITVADLLALNVEDVIKLDSKIDNPVNAYVDNKVKFKVVPGLAKTKLAVQITDVVEEGVDNSE